MVVKLDTFTDGNDYVALALARHTARVMVLCMTNTATETTTATKIPALTIELERCEGRTFECITETVRRFDGSGEAGEVDVFAMANAMLLRWASTAPKDGGYHKCAFVVTYMDGETYSGRFDLTGNGFPNLADHMRFHCEASSGRRVPGHTTAERWTAYLNDCVPQAKREALALFLDTYQIGAA